MDAILRWYGAGNVVSVEKTSIFIIGSSRPFFVVANILIPKWRAGNPGPQKIFEISFRHAGSASLPGKDPPLLRLSVNTAAEWDSATLHINEIL